MSIKVIGDKSKLQVKMICPYTHVFGEDLGSGRRSECVLDVGHDERGEPEHQDKDGRWWTVNSAYTSADKKSQDGVVMDSTRYVFGWTIDLTKRARSCVVAIKRMPDGTHMVVEERLDDAALAFVNNLMGMKKP